VTLPRISTSGRGALVSAKMPPAERHSSVCFFPVNDAEKWFAGHTAEGRRGPHPDTALLGSRDTGEPRGAWPTAGFGGALS
jgi:hypothetical protein